MSNIIQIKSSQNLTKKKHTFSLPKTQPTRCSSSQRIYNNDMSKYQQIQTCPQVAQFTYHKGIDDSFYIHKMNIDFGHIQQPNYWPKKFINAKNIQDNNSQRALLRNIEGVQQKQTERMTPFQKINQLQGTMKHKTNKTLVRLSKSVNAIHREKQQRFETNKKLADSKIQNEQYDNKQNNEVFLNIQNSSNKKQVKSNQKLSSNKKQKFNANHIDNKNFKLKEVLANKLRSQQNSLQSTNNKNFSQQTTQRIQFMKDSSQKQKTQRRVPHCRIVKSYVGGSKMQIKIINYPDNSEYVKLVGL